MVYEKDGFVLEISTCKAAFIGLGHNMGIGKHVQNLRKSQKISLRRLAAEADISVAYLVNIEKGESSPTLEVLQKFADAFNTTLAEMTKEFDKGSSLQLPNSLQAFIDGYGAQFVELHDTDWQRALANVRLRGKYPDNSDDWLPIFVSMRQALVDKL